MNDPRRRPLIIGEHNPYRSDSHYDLYPAPRGSAGYRLAKHVLGLSRIAYMNAYDRVNLCHGATWTMKEARSSWARIQSEESDRPGLILCGSKVCKVVGCRFYPYAAVDVELSGGVQVTAVVLPHPSGRSSFWNEPGAYEQARAALKLRGLL